MRKQVADASALLSVILDEERADSIREVSQGVDFIAPESLPWEIGNALVINVRKKRLRLNQAKEAFQIFDQIPIRLVHVEQKRAITIADEENIYAYDAYMLDCAGRHRAPLLTLDLQLRSVAQKRDIAVLPEYIEGDDRYS